MSAWSSEWSGGQRHLQLVTRQSTWGHGHMQESSWKVLVLLAEIQLVSVVLGLGLTTVFRFRFSAPYKQCFLGKLYNFFYTPKRRELSL